jgi:hypothetical protein
MLSSFEINIFKDLVVKFPLWKDLKEYIESDEGGAFRIVDENTENRLCIIRYEKNVSNMDLEHSKWFRCIVWDTEHNLPVCIAPSKASNKEHPYRTIKELTNANITCQEFLEGFMINCFKRCNDDNEYITSRSKLDATGRFYSHRTFNELFRESYNTSYPNTELSDTIGNPDSSKKEVSQFVSFLVQHMDHRIVKNITENKVYIIHRGTVYSDGTILIDESESNTICTFTFGAIPIRRQTYAAALLDNDVSNQLDTIYEIEIENENKNSEVDNWIRSIFADKSWDFQGLVFRDNSGNRWRYRSDKYNAIRSLRGNNSNTRERFAILYSQNLVFKYLEYYPEEMLDITMYTMFINSFNKILYDIYVDFHIRKTITIDKINKIIHPHLYRLHGLFLTNLRPHNKKLGLSDVVSYIHNEPWQRISFLIKNIYEGGIQLIQS